jgi:hypothetical protein
VHLAPNLEETLRSSPLVFFFGLIDFSVACCLAKFCLEEATGL